LPVFKVLKNAPNFQWTPECYKSFEELKIYLSSPNVFLNLEKERPCSYTWGWQTGLLVRYWLGRKKEYNVRSTMLAKHY
jgi:hypothetical protein